MCIYEELKTYYTMAPYAFAGEAFSLQHPETPNHSLAGSHKVLVCRASFYHIDIQCNKKRVTKGLGCHPARSHCSPWTKLPFQKFCLKSFKALVHCFSLFYSHFHNLHNREAGEFSRRRQWNRWSSTISESASDTPLLHEKKAWINNFKTSLTSLKMMTMLMQTTRNPAILNLHLTHRKQRL